MPALFDLDCGPLIRASQQARVTGFLEHAARTGIAGVACDEVFGPVLAAMPFDDEEHAVRLANATDLGLVAGGWTCDGGRPLRMARAVRSGRVFVNNLRHG